MSTSLRQWSRLMDEALRRMHLNESRELGKAQGVIMDSHGRVTHAITEIQPWGTAIMYLGKDVENRTWPPPKWAIGKRIAIHAGKKVDDNVTAQLGLLGLCVEDVPTSAILGTVQLCGYLKVWPGGRREAHGLSSAQAQKAFESQWRATPVDRLLYAWLLDWPEPFHTPIPCRGAQGLWRIQDS